MNTLALPEAAMEARERLIPTPFRRFRPNLVLGYQEGLQALTRRLADLPEQEASELLAEAISGVDRHVAELLAVGLTPTDLAPTTRYAATLRVLRDLLLQGWRIRDDDEGVILDAPRRPSVAIQDPERVKEALRRSFSFAREAQLRQDATRTFIEAMERRGIGVLFANGADLATRLSRGASGLTPEIELIEPGARDAATGLLLQDIWRYARLYWSIPYQSTPGRNVFYLIRDAAVPSRPLIGIAALGNPVLGLSQRDDHFGWSARGLLGRLPDLTDQARRGLAEHLRVVIAQGFEETYSKDLLPPTWQTNWRTAVQTLEEIERRSAEERLEQLHEAGEGRSAEYLLIRSAHSAVEEGRAASIDWERIAQTSLYRRKRAGTLADLVRAHGVFAELGLGARGASIENALRTEEGVRAVEIALRRVKQQVIASSVMELITCGAVRPYRDILGGKLVAMLMLSREVVAQSGKRYADRVSIIASALAGRSITRPARLALLTTSSLYAVGSSQYNRIRIPVGDTALSYRRIGMTESFGTMHFAPDTVGYLNAVARLAEDNRRDVNNLFGEGTSPKMRLVRSGLEALGLHASTFLQHHSPRLLYAAALCSNIQDVMLGLSETPKYIIPGALRGTELIVNHWRERWLATRSHRPEILERLRGERFESFRLSLETANLEEVHSAGRRATQVQEGTPLERIVSVQATDDQTFIERLYRSTKSYADRLSPEELESIHVDLGVDKYLLQQAKAGRQIVVTGNPGDGKTHLIQRLRSDLEALGARVITDANACSDEEILDAWEICRKEGRPFVLAINEWPLYVLQRLARTRGIAAVDEALRQVTEARFFVEEQRPEPPKGDVLVIDLSLRNLLAPTVVEAVIDRLTQERFFVNLNPADPALANREALRHLQARARLIDLLQLVGARTGHVTMRQLVGFVAFLITGGQSAADRLKAGQDATGFTYSTLAFEGGIGPLFEAVRAVFDPATATHPVWDERLWLGDTDPRDWIRQVPPGPMTLPESERAEAHRAIKRRFFFEHVKGGDLLDLVPQDEQEFEEVLREEEAAKTGLVRELVLALNRFYEPDCPDDDRDKLVLWQSHRYDVRAPLTFVALHDLPHDQLRIERPKVASWVEAWLPKEQLDRRSFALVASTVAGDVALVEIDRELYLTLFEAQRGLGRASWSRTATRRITRFVDKIDRAVEKSSGVEDIRIRNVESDLEERFAIQRKPARYQL